MGPTEPPSAANALLLKRIADPQTLRHWLADVEDRLKHTPSDRRLELQRGNLLRALGDLSAARAAFAAISASPLPDPARDRPLAILSGERFDWADRFGPVPFVRLNAFLSSDQQIRLWDVVRRANLQPARITLEAGAVEPERRQADIASGASEIRGWFLPLVEAALDREQVLPRLGLSPFDPSHRELQITGHKEGGFFCMHKDSGLKNRDRYLTFVYYFHRQPARFSGGELLLYDQDSQGCSTDPLAFTRLAPLHNSLILFPSDRWHAVASVTMDSTDPLDGRWTVNGWLHRHADDMDPQPETRA